MMSPISESALQSQPKRRSLAPWNDVPIVCFANDWEGDPTSKHHIMREYSEDTDVLWIESSGMRRPRLSQLRDLRRIMLRLRRSARGMQRHKTRIRVVSPLGIPLPGNRVAARINGIIYRRAVRQTTKRLGWHKTPLLWVYTPTVSSYLPAMQRRGLVYHCVDRWWEFAEYDREVMCSHHAELCRDADVVFASSLALLDDCRKYAQSVYLIPHGVDWRHFAAAALSPMDRPADIADIDGPIIGFFGLVHEWIDQDVICRIAEAFPDATLVLIGSIEVDVDRLRARPNIRLLGRRSYTALPAYCAAFDVGLIPFVFNELTRAVNPVKLREYLSAGVPIVASALPEILRFADHPMVHVARTPDDFVVRIRDSLDRVTGRNTRREVALAMEKESWTGRCEEMAQLVRKHVE